jgi:hypothetical protein
MLGIFNDFIALFQMTFYLKVWHVIYATWPLWSIVFFSWFFMSTWMTYKRREWLKKQGSILLEIIIPQNTDKTPAAMEMVLEGIWEDVVGGTLVDVYLNGVLRDVFSLEIASIDGKVRFFIWAFPKWKQIIETRVYGHYPGAEVVEVEDYATKVIFDPETMNLVGVTTRLVKADAYPIKTYIDFGLDKGGQEQEEIIDPLVPILEYLGTLKPGENQWIQIVIQGHRKEGLQDGLIFPKANWKEGIKNEITKFIEIEAAIKPEAGKPASLLNLSKTQSDTIAAIERNSAKLAFDTMWRMVYVAPKDIFVKTRLTGIIGAMRQFGSQNLNGLRPHEFIPGIVYPWNDFHDIRRRDRQRTLLEAYKRRSIFNVPFRHVLGKPYVLTTEELATLFHFPGSTATTPTLARVATKKGVPPPNLPT